VTGQALVGLLAPRCVAVAVIHQAKLACEASR